LKENSIKGVELTFLTSLDIELLSIFRYIRAKQKAEATATPSSVPTCPTSDQDFDVFLEVKGFCTYLPMVHPGLP
jgi:hypothetical protein